ncbi:MAG: prephenate dehydrogenase [Candidatus Omnitrophica bacterium]|nr:prephenate dehydrogenase [Candidatus Omnitrophota bacterium]
MRVFDKVVIIGTGLIGASLGLDLKKRRLVGQITGLSRHNKNAYFSKKMGAVDQAVTSLDAVQDADLVILATPVDTIIDIGLKIAKKIKRGCIVIDVGSSKENIVFELSKVIPNFIGCHPMAGSEKRGAFNLQAGIFNGSVCIITPNSLTNNSALNKIRLFWRRLGSRIVVLSPEKHDQILALTSHLPHAIAFSLINTIPDEFLNLSSGGLKDSTRIAASDNDLWSQIFLSNRRNLLDALLTFQAKLNILKLALRNKNKKLLSKFLGLAREKRKKLK